jgi:hypothetical protein
MSLAQTSDYHLPLCLITLASLALSVSPNLHRSDLEHEPVLIRATALA